MTNIQVKRYSARLYILECPALFGNRTSKNLGVLVPSTSQHFKIFLPLNHDTVTQINTCNVHAGLSSNGYHDTFIVTLPNTCNVHAELSSNGFQDIFMSAAYLFCSVFLICLLLSDMSIGLSFTLSSNIFLLYIFISFFFIFLFFFYCSNQIIHIDVVVFLVTG